MTNILLLVETIQCKQFRYIYLIHKNKNFWIFLSIFQMYMKFLTFSKKDDPHSLCISEITGPERRG